MALLTDVPDTAALDVAALDVAVLDVAALDAAVLDAAVLAGHVRAQRHPGRPYVIYNWRHRDDFAVNTLQ